MLTSLMIGALLATSRMSSLSPSSSARLSRSSSSKLPDRLLDDVLLVPVGLVDQARDLGARREDGLELHAEHGGQVVHRVGVERRGRRDPHRPVRLVRGRRGSSCARTGPGPARRRRGARPACPSVSTYSMLRLSDMALSRSCSVSRPLDSRTLSSGQPVSRWASSACSICSSSRRLSVAEGAEEGVLHGGSSSRAERPDRPGGAERRPTSVHPGGGAVAPPSGPAPGRRAVRPRGLSAARRAARSACSRSGLTPGEARVLEGAHLVETVRGAAGAAEAARGRVLVLAGREVRVVDLRVRRSARRPSACACRTPGRARRSRRAPP